MQLALLQPGVELVQLVVERAHLEHLATHMTMMMIEDDGDDDDEDDDLLEHLCVELSVGARPHIVLVKCLNLVEIIKYRYQ